MYIVNKAGGLIFSHDQPSSTAEVEATFNYPLGLVLDEVDRNIVVKYGERHGIQGKLSWMLVRYVQRAVSHLTNSPPPIVIVP